MSRICAYLAALLILAAAGYGTYHGIVSYGERRYAAGQKAQVDLDTAAALKASETVRAKEAEQAKTFDAIAKQHQLDLADAQAKSDRVIADLRSGNLRLRKAWSCVPGTPAVAASAGGSDGAADDRETSSGRIVRAAADADSKIRSLQALLTAERQP